MAMAVLTQHNIHQLLSGLKRALLLLSLVTVATFTLLSMSPINPLIYYTGDALFSISADQKALMAQHLGFDQSIFARFIIWVSHVMQGDLGFSISMQQPVVDVIAERLPLSLQLMISSWLGTLVIGYLLGVIAAFHKDRWLDRAISTLCWITASSPSFWLGIIALSLFSVNLQLTPVCCAAPIGYSAQDLQWWQQIPYLILPVSVLIITNLNAITMHTREKVIDVLASEHVLYATIHGESKRGIFYFHLLRNTLAPALIIHFAGFSELLGGSMLVETVFNYPGISESLVNAGLNGDIALLMAITLMASLLVFSGNALARLCNHILLPRGQHYVQ